MTSLPSRRRAFAVALGALLCAILAPRDTAANSAPAVFFGERHAPLAPQQSTNVRVDREDLVFDLTREAPWAEVTATYRMTATNAERVDVAFAYIRSSLDAFKRPGPDPKAAVEIDGAPTDVTLVTDGELLEPRLRAWLAERPEAERALREAAAHPEAGEEAERAVQAAGGRCVDQCWALRSWIKSDPTRPFEVHQRHDFALDAARSVIPDEVAALHGGWSTLSEHRRLAFLVFHVDFAAAQTRAVTVRYEHAPGADRDARVTGLYQFEYLLSPAKRWAGFGPLDVTIRLPDDLRFSSSSQFRREGRDLHASFPTLPEGELVFSVVPQSGLWHGLDRHEHYWAILASAAMLAALAVGALLGKLVRSQPRGQRVLLCIVGAGLAAALAAHGALVPLRASLPRHALVFDNGWENPPADPGFLVPLAGLAGVAAALFAAFTRARRPVA